MNFRIDFKTILITFNPIDTGLFWIFSDEVGGGGGGGGDSAVTEYLSNRKKNLQDI